MIKAILWDIDGTLLDFGGSERYAVRKCFSLFGLGECSDEMLKRYSAINTKYWQMLELGTLTKPEVLRGRFEEFFASEKIDFSDVDAFNAEYQVRLGDEVFFNDGGYELVRDLKGKVGQYAVTNGTFIAQERKLKKAGLDVLFDGIFISDKIGVEKPNIGFFDRVFEEIGSFSGDEVMIVGDSLSSDIRGGNNAGILCCWYNPKGLTDKKELRVDYDIRSLQQVKDLL